LLPASPAPLNAAAAARGAADSVVCEISTPPGSDEGLTTIPRLIGLLLSMHTLASCSARMQWLRRASPMEAR